MHTLPSPIAIKQAILEAIHEYNKANPDYMFPACAPSVIRDAVTKECNEHLAAMKKAGKL
tara:strand:+ start:8244 stop:8423 length:180 start_codon:yes stop_codon:yes gene_type:complete